MELYVVVRMREVERVETTRNRYATTLFNAVVLFTTQLVAEQKSVSGFIGLRF